MYHGKVGPNNGGHFNAIDDGHPFGAPDDLDSGWGAPHEVYPPPYSQAAAGGMSSSRVHKTSHNESRSHEHETTHTHMTPHMQSSSRTHNSSNVSTHHSTQLVVQQQPQQPQQPAPQPVAAQPNVIVVTHGPQAINTLQRPPNYLCCAIFVCLCCNWPIGIIAIIFSCMSSSASDSGDTEKARTYGRVSCGLNVFACILVVLSIIITVAVILSAASSNNDDTIEINSVESDECAYAECNGDCCYYGQSCCYNYYYIARRCTSWPSSYNYCTSS